MHRVSRTSLFLAALCAACAAAPEPEPAGLPIASAGAWPVEGAPGIQLVADRIALDACFAEGGLLAGATGATAPSIDFGKYWCVLATDGRGAGEPTLARLAVGGRSEERRVGKECV